jgi:hypothetical protein
MKVCGAVLLSLFCARPVPANEPSRIPIVIHVHIYDAVDESELRPALEQTTRALRSGGIEPEWRRVPAGRGSVPGEREFVLSLLSPAMTRQKCAVDGIGEAVLGTSSPETARAWIFVDRIRIATRRRGLTLTDILGQVITHELGHLLLGADPVHGEGIMRDPVHLTGATDLRFTPRHARRMRSNLTRTAPGSLPPVLADVAFRPGRPDQQLLHAMMR